MDAAVDQADVFAIVDFGVARSRDVAAAGSGESAPHLDRHRAVPAHCLKQVAEGRQVLRGAQVRVFLLLVLEIGEGEARPVLELGHFPACLLAETREEGVQGGEFAGVLGQFLLLRA